MARFSQRMGFIPARTVLQLNSMDEGLRTGLWNALAVFYWHRLRETPLHGGHYLSENSNHYVLCHELWVRFFKWRLDTLHDEWREDYQTLRKWFFEDAQWAEVYDFVECVSAFYPDEELNIRFREHCNQVLKEEKSGYRFVGDKLAPITSGQEMDAVQEALEIDVDTVAEHIAQAIALFSNRTDPDFRNSIKESISSVEALVRRCAGGKKGGLGPLLDRLEKEVGLHPALSSAFKMLFGYTSDESGIRHALLEKSAVDIDDAKFMLVACSAFVNYVRSRLSEARKAPT
jgi:AbiJ N-terminal domain 4